MTGVAMQENPRVSKTRMANEAWEAMFRAQVELQRAFSEDDVWGELSQSEYDVLYALSKAKRGLSMVELNRNILMSQGGVSRLVARLVERGLVARCEDETDRRASQLTLTDEGLRLQRVVGRRHAAAVSRRMNNTLSYDEMLQLRDLTQKITDIARASEVEEMKSK